MLYFDRRLIYLSNSNRLVTIRCFDRIILYPCNSNQLITITYIYNSLSSDDLSNGIICIYLIVIEIGSRVSQYFAI